MRLRWVALLVLLAGCVTSAPAVVTRSALQEAPASLAFDGPVQALPHCGLDLQANCHEPSLAVLPDGVVLVANSFAAPMARSTDGAASFTLLPPVLGPAATGGGDALLQLAPDGSVWWSTLDPTGLLVARSANGGLTWSAPVRVDMGAPTDRQWLAFGAKDGAMFATVQGKGGIRAAVSHDAGATWERPIVLTSATAIGGAPTTVASGWIVPRFDYANQSLVVDASADEGARWTTHVAYVNASSPGDFFPIAHADGGDIVLTWRAADRTVLLSRSTDGGASWSTPLQASRPGERVAASPWLAGEGERLTLAYFASEQDAGPATLHVVRIANETAARGVAAQGILTTVRKDRPGNTDFADVALDTTGRAFAVFAASDGSIEVARERR